MIGDDTARCRTYGAAIVWVPTATTGTPMPLDADPTPGGNVVLDDTLLGQVARVIPPSDPRPTGRPLWRSHFATCPDAAAHRRRPDRPDGVGR